jgi:arginine repressor
MDHAKLQEHLARAEKHIREAESRIARQRELIARLKKQGHDPYTAQNLLRNFEELQLLLHAERERIRAELAEGKDDSSTLVPHQSPQLGQS